MNHPNNQQKQRQPGMTALGQAMPDVLKTPVLTQVEASEVTEAEIDTGAAVAIKAGKLCMIEEGITFTGNAALQGTCTIAGQIVGNLKEQAGATSQVVITETGSVKGDIFRTKSLSWVRAAARLMPAVAA